jgi:GTP-binding protein
MKTLLLKNARFIISGPDAAHLPKDGAPEFVFLGRSNVGKSSLLNLVAGQHHLAHTSRTPGRTRLLNYFVGTLQKSVRDEAGINRSERNIAIVDLPGYGYAKMSEGERRRLSEMITEYVTTRSQIAAILHLVDIRRDPTPEEQSLSQQLRMGQVGYLLVATKTDKVVKSQRQAARNKIANAFEVSPNDVILASVIEKFGQDEIWERMWNWMARFESSP